MGCTTCVRVRESSKKRERLEQNSSASASRVDADLTDGIPPVSGVVRMFAEGVLEAAFGLWRWHTVQLTAAACELKAVVDGVVVASVEDAGCARQRGWGGCRVLVARNAVSQHRRGSGGGAVMQDVIVLNRLLGCPSCFINRPTRPAHPSP
jgi:hypothetical protein